MSAADILGLSDDIFLIRNRGWRCCDARAVGGTFGEFILGSRTVSTEEVRAFAQRLRSRGASPGPKQEASIMTYRGKSLSQVIEDMVRVQASYNGSVSKLCLDISAPVSSWSNAVRGHQPPSPAILHALYGPAGNRLRPELIGVADRDMGDTEALSTGEPATKEEPAEPVPDAAAEADTSVAPTPQPVAYCGLSVGDLLSKMRRDAISMENELDELLACIKAIEQTATQYAIAAHRG